VDYKSSDTDIFEFRYFIFWQAIGVLLIVMITWLSLTPKPPNINLPIEWGDKLLHFSAYFTLMFWHGQIYRQFRSRLIWMFLFIAMGIGIEFLQGMGEARMFEWADAVANSVGALAAIFILKTKMACWLIFFERRFIPR